MVRVRLILETAALLVLANGRVLPSLNGTIAAPGQFPFLAFIEQKVPFSTEAQYCVGSLISDQYVLTSYLCLSHLRTTFSVLLGADDWKKPSDTQIRFDNLIFDNVLVPKPVTAVRDIGLVKLPEKVEFTDRVQSIFLPRWRDIEREYSHEFGLVAGWGPRYPSGIVTEPQTYVTYSEVRVNETCEFGGTETICTDMQMTSYFEEGQPLYVYSSDRMPTLIGTRGGFGAVSGGRTIDVYVRITKNLEWIAENSNVEIPT